MFCEFEQYDDYHVKCIHCDRRLSGTPEKYEGKIVCKAQGIGTDFSKLMQRWATTFRIHYTKCPKCLSLEEEMNVEGAKWVRDRHDAIVRIVVDNAKEQGITIPGMAISNMLKIVEKPNVAKLPREIHG